jgi:hypothetical protein
MENWRINQVTGDLKSVPGIGPAAIKAFLKDPDDMTRITNTHQLIGQYLMLKGPDDDDHSCSIRELNQKFWYFLKTKGITAHRSAIVLAIYLKVASFFPDLSDMNEEDYEDDNDE